MSRRKWRRNKTAGGPAVIELLESRLMLAAAAGDVDGDDDFDANDSFLIHLVNLAGTDAQIVQSKGNSPRTATQIRSGIEALQTNGDVDGDLDFDANDSFLIHLVELAGTDEQLEQSKGSSPLSVSAIRSNISQLKNVITEATVIASLSPASGEEMVSVTRETVVRFTNPVDPQTVTTDSFYLIANGERVPGRIRVSSTERFATFLYDEPLPAATEVRVVVNGDQIMDRDGVLLDADGDNQPGGVLRADFRTLPLTRIPGTNVFGFVKDSVTGEPIEGATIRVDAFPEANVVTDENGRFELVDMPAPEFFVHIDGSTSTSAAAGFVYPNVGKPFHSVPGQTVQLEMNREVFDIYLPPMAVSDAVGLSATQTTNVGFGAAGRAELQTMFPNIDPATWDRLQVSFGPGSAIDDQGNAATSAAVIPVPPDRIPGPLPPNLNPQLVVSIQASGATSFDVPAPVTFPNLEGLAPGEKSLIFSFDHDAGRWVVVGTGTVSSDGLTIESDPGVGIVAPGWHLTQPGVDLEISLHQPWQDDLQAAKESFYGKFEKGLESAFKSLIGVGKGLEYPFFDGASKFVGGLSFADKVKNCEFRGQFPSCWDVLFVQGLQAANALTGGKVAPIKAAASVVKTVDKLSGEIRFQQEYEAALQNLNAAKAAAAKHMEAVEDLQDSLKELSDLTNEISDQLAELSSTLQRMTQELDDFEKQVNESLDRIDAALDGPGGRLDLQNPADVATFDDQLDEGVNGTNDADATTIVLPPAPMIAPDVHATDQTVVPSPQAHPPDVQDLLDNESENGQVVVFVPAPSTTGSDVSDSTTGAFVLDIPTGSGQSVDSIVGDNQLSANDVDIFRFMANAGDTISINVQRLSRSLTGSHLRLFNAAGSELAADTQSGAGWNPEVAWFEVPTTDTYYIGVSSYGNTDYNPAVSGSGANGHFTGSYRLSVRRWDGAVTKRVVLKETLRDFAAAASQVSSSSSSGFYRQADAFLQDIDTTRSTLRRIATMPLQHAAFVSVTDQTSGLVFRGRSLASGTFSTVVAAEQTYDVSIYDPVDDLTFTTTVDTGVSGSRTVIDYVVLGSDTFTSTDEDGLSDIAEQVVGSLPDNSDSDNDGVDDWTEIQQGLDPLGGRAFPTGIIASLPLLGEAKDVVLHSSPENPGRQLAYLATGSHGIAIVDTSQFNNPIVLGQLELPGDVTNLAVDSSRQLAVLAADTEGLHLVNVSDPMQPALVQTLDVASSQVIIHDGLVYIAVDNEIRSYDLSTAELLERLAVSSARITGMAREGRLLVTMDNQNTLRTIELGSFGMVESGSVTLQHGGGRVFVGGGVAYAPASSYFRGGFATVDVRSPENPIILSESDVVSPFISPNTDVLPNGSGIGLLLGRAGVQRVLDVMDLSDLSNTDRFITRVALPAAPFSATMGSGLAYVADGTAGLQVINVLPFDNQRQPPVVTINSEALDIDTGTAGIQVQEGSTLSIRSDIQDDVQVRNVELLIDGQVVANDVSFPFDLTTVVPTLSGQTSSIELQLRATDTGGNVSVSNAANTLTLNIVPDTFAPEVVQVTPGEGSRRFAGHQSVRVLFSEPMAAASLTAASVQLVDVSAATTPIIPQQIQLRRDGHELQLIFEPLPIGDYQLTVQAASVTDRAGNAIGGADIVSQFSIIEDRDPGDTLATALDLGVLDAAITLSDRIGEDELGNADPGDVVAFRISQPRQISIDLTNRTDGSQLRLIADLNDNGIIDSGEVLRTAGTGGIGDQTIQQNLEPGRYFVQVLPWSNNDVTAYDLTLVAGTIILPTTPQDPGETLGTALDMGAISNTTIWFRDMYGVRDRNDFYRFSIDAPREIQIDLTGRLEGGEMRLIADLNDNGQIDSGEVLRTAGTSGSADRFIVQNLEAGTWFLQVRQWNNGNITPYDIAVTPGTIIIPTTPQDPGETLGTALDMGTLISSGITYHDMVGVRDRNDFYQFSVDAPREVQVDLTGRLEGSEVRLIADLNNNGLIDSGEVLRTAGTSGSADRSIVQNLEAATYFLQVRQWNNVDITPYDITVTPGTILIPTTPQDPGETLGTALDMGALTTAAASFRDMYGVLDREDFYRFSIDAPREVQIDLTGRLEGGEVRLIADLNNDGDIDSGEVLRTAGTSGSADRSIVQNLEAGTWFLQVRQWSNVHISPYEISVTPGVILVPTTPQDPGETLGAALDMGAISSTAVSFRDMYGVHDREDFYRFSVDAPREVQIDLTGRLEGGEVRLIADLDNDGLIDSGEVLRTAGTSGFADRSIVQNLEPGTWFLQVRQWSSLHISPYEISVTAGAVLTTTTPQDPGETLGTALDMGAIGSTAVSFRDMYGVHDREDFYQFSIDTSREIQIDLTGRLDGGEVRLIADQNSNGQIDFGEVLRTAGTSLTGDRSIVENLAAGTYFLQIRQWGNTDITPYLITVTP